MNVLSADADRASPRWDTRFAPWIQLAAALIVAFALVLFLTPHGAAVSPDSIFYLDIASHIHQGAGVKSIDYALAHAGENRAVPNTTWPPLYPALLALSPVPPGVASAAVLSAVLLAITLFCVQRTLSRFLAWPFAMLAGLPVAVLVPMLTIHTFAWSEQLFIAILAALLWAVQVYLTGGPTLQLRRRLLVAIALLLVLAFYTRYVGVLFFALLPVLYLLDRRPRHLLPIYLGCGLFCAATALALLFYNAQVGGEVMGTARAAAHSGLVEQLRSLVSALVPCFLVPGASGSIALCALFAMAAAFYLLSGRRTPVQQRDAVSMTALLAFGGALYYLVGIVLLRSFVAFDDIDVRLISVAVPSAWIGGVALIAAFEQRLVRAIPAVVAAGAIAALLVSGYFTAASVREQWRTQGTPWFRLNASNAYNNYNVPPMANQNRKFLAPHTDSGSVLVTDLPQVLRYTTGLAAFALPTEFSAAEMAKLAGFPARSYILLDSGQRSAIEAALQQRGARAPEVTVAGDTVLLHLPLTLNASSY